jgi:integrase
LNAAALGWSDKTLSNHKSNATAALQHFIGVANVPKRGVPLSPLWTSALSPIREIPARRLIGGLGRFCSARSIAPRDVTIATVLDYVDFKEQTTFHKGGDVYFRSIAKAWNRCVAEIPGFPSSILSVQESKANRPDREWEDFPEGLRTDIEQYLSSLAVPHRSANGKKRRGNKASTIATRRRELTAFARAAVEAGIDIQQLSSLKALLHSDTVTKTFESYLPCNGNPAPTYVIDLAWKLLSIARMIGAPAETIANLDDIRFQLEEERGPTLTEKNLVIIRQVMSTDFWPKVARLPASLFSSALKMQNRQPKKAIALAVTALQMQILTRAPIRIGNLLQVKLDKHLVRIAPDKFRLHFEEYDVKNRVDLDFELSGDTAEMIEAFITHVRPKLEGKSKTDWLFPGADNRSRLSSHASTAIARVVEKYIGVRITAHQFRHAAAAMVLKQEPGNYEFARRVLGHKNVVTTQRFYSGLESFAAAKMFGELIESSATTAQPTTQRKRRAS